MAGLFCGDGKVEQNSQATPLVMCSNITDIPSGTELIVTYNVIKKNVDGMNPHIRFIKTFPHHKLETKNVYQNIKCDFRDTAFPKI